MRPYSVREQRVFDDLEERQVLLLTPREYGSVVGSYLTSRSIKHEIVWIADLAVV